MIYLVFTDDWELRGNGSGDAEALQFQPMRKLINIFNRYGARASFYVEIMQQLTCRRLQGRFSELKALADRWDAAVLEAYRQGHDIQLHMHFQWKHATYEEGHWNLKSPWSLLQHDPADVRQMIAEGKSYLETLLRRVNRNYRCIAFRAGAWCIAPCSFALPILAESGFILDTSIVGGLRYRTKHLELDYRNVEESFGPYYPSMGDARRLSTRPEPIVCMPTHHHRGKRLQYLRRDIKLAWQHIASNNGRVPSEGDWADRSTFTLLRPVRKAVHRYLLGETHISDISRLDYSLLSKTMSTIRKQGRKRKIKHIPVVLASHSKDIHNFDDIDHFVCDVTRAGDVCCLTLTELAGKLTDGSLPVRHAN